MKAGVIGSGQVAQVLAKGLKDHGYDVTIGSREPAKLTEFQTKTGIKAVTFEEAARWGEMLILAVKGTGAEKAIRQAGIANLKSKTVIDVTNPIAEEPPVNGVIKFFTGPNDSLMEQLQKTAPDAHFVKAFSCVGNAFMVHPKFPDGKPTMFICGNNDAAKKTVNELLVKFGWDIADMGKVEAARAIEPLCMLWCIPGFINNSWTHAFKLLRM